MYWTRLERYNISDFAEALCYALTNKSVNLLTGIFSREEASDRVSRILQQNISIECASEHKIYVLLLVHLVIVVRDMPMCML